MAELASRAVQSLLGVIRDETRLLGRVETDVKFIMEMESMNSFLLHLGRSEGHGEPVHTWVKQVRVLANDCSDSIDSYLLCGSSAVCRRDRSPLGYIFWWVPLYMKKLVAQHKAAIQLSELKVRARGVADRRLRYDVHIPNPATTGSGGDPASLSRVIGMHNGEEEDDDDDDDDEHDGPGIRDHLARRELIFADHCTKEECRVELADWLCHIQVEPKTRYFAASNQDEGTNTVNVSGSTTVTMESNQEEGSNFGEQRNITIAGQQPFWSRAIVAPRQEEGADVASGAIFAAGADFDYKFQINVSTGPTVMPTGLPAGAFDILEPIMNQLAMDEQDKEAQLKTEAEIQEVNEAQQIRDIDEKIDKIKAKVKKLLHTTSTTMSINNVSLLEVEPLDILLHGIQDKSWVQVPNLDKSIDQMKKQKIEETAKKIKEHMESSSSSVVLDHQEYVNILQKRLGRTDEEATDKPDDEIGKNIKEIMLKIKSVEEATDKLGDEQIAKNIQETAEKIIMVSKLQELLLKLNEADKQAEEEKKGTNKLHRMLERKIGQITNTTDAVMQDIEVKLQSKMADKIKRYTHGADEFCNPPREPVLCSLAASYYKKVLKIMMKQPINYNTSIFHDILERCEPHQFSMKIFAHAMCANPRRKKEELHRLLDTLTQGPGDITNDEMVKFSYNDLPKEYKTCLLYLAIFQPKESINRSRLIGRWVVEGLITKQDWSSSVRQAERCFDALIDRYLICHVGNITATEKVKSCTVDPRVHEFITKVARKEHFVGTRLSRHMARQLFIFSDIRLRSSDILERSLGKLSGTPKLPLVKVLDLEGCEDLDNKNCLKHICTNMLLLKYLSLRDTGITELPRQINNLHQLEVLDIRQKGNIVTASTTRDVLLLKLKRLLAGSPTAANTQNVWIPRGIAKMTNLEVLSRLKASSSRAGQDLKDIGRLWQLRKLGVVVDDDRPGHLTYLLEAIGDLSESLRSLSITLTCGKGGPDYDRDMGENIGENYSKNPPKFLESLRIDGYTCKGQLLPWLLKDKKLPALAKVTLCNTFLKEGNMKHIAELDNLCCLRLMCGAYTDSRLSFLCAKFQKLKYLLVECGKPDEISFDVGAAPELSKIVWSFTSKEESLSPTLSGINNLTKLKELEFNRDGIPSQVMQDIANHPNKKNLALKMIKPRQGQEASAAAAAP